MPVIGDVVLSLKTAEVLRRQRLRQRARVRPETRLLIREVLSSVKESRLLGPTAVYKYCAAGDMTGSRISL